MKSGIANYGKEGECQCCHRHKQIYKHGRNPNGRIHYICESCYFTYYYGEDIGDF